MFIAALFTIAMTRKQPECPLTDDWIRKMWYIYTMEYYSGIKKNKLMPFASTCLELETHTEWSKWESKRQMLYITYLESNIRHKWTFPQKRKSWTGKTYLWLPRRRGREWDGLGFGVNRCKLLPLEWITNESLLYSIWTITGCLWWSMIIWEKRIYICMCDWVTLLYSRKLKEYCKLAIMGKNHLL